MKKDKIMYWISTGIIVAVMLWSAINFAFNPEMKEAAKLLGVLALVVPGVPHKIREFAYFGFAIVLLSTPVAHLSSGDSVLLEVFHTFFFVTLVVSYLYYYKVSHRKFSINM